MPFPSYQRVVYRSNPLAEVICQLRFPPILRIATEAPAGFQESIRGDYPLYRQEELMGLQMPPQLASIVKQFGLPVPAEAVVHRFSSRDSHCFVTLSQGSVALTETRYSRWESFKESLERVVAALQESYAPAFYTRIGLRYRDVICRSELGLAEVPWGKLLQPYILGPLGADEVAGAIGETTTQSSFGLPSPAEAKVRLVHGLAKAADKEEQCYLIDSDFSIAREEGVDDPFGTLKGFNRGAGNLFRWAITDQLHEAMGPTPIPAA